MVSGVQRNFLVHRPTSVTNRARAIVLVLHGGGGSASQTSNLQENPLAVFRTVADRENIVVVFPDGLSNNWNDCRGDAPGLLGVGDDVAFFDALIARLQAEFGVDSRSVFLSGASNGALMSERYAFERAERIGGIAITIGNLPAQPRPGRCTDGPARATPALLTHGTDDQTMPYSGGCVAEDRAAACMRGKVISAEATRDRWIAINALTGVVPQTTRIENANDDGGPANRFIYPGATPVEWWRLDGAGHTVPSRTLFYNRAMAGLQNHDIEFAEVAWAFFATRLP